MTSTFGPVPSRRLGRSLGVNNIPPKYCSYACVYCQLGDPQHVTITRQNFFRSEEIAATVASVLRSATGAETDYITIVPDGEPTLDLGLFELMTAIRSELDQFRGKGTGDSGILAPRLAVITNGSLLTDPEVAAALALADWVSVKIDAADEKTWRLIDRPARAASFSGIMEAIGAFAHSFTGTCATETMLVDGINTDPLHLEAIADLVASIDPDIAYISIPTRPPAEEWVSPPSEEQILSAYTIFKRNGIPVELNVEHEEGDFVAGTDIAGSILSIAAVHPIRESDLEKMLTGAGANKSVVDELMNEDRLLRREYRGEIFYVTRLKPRRS